MDRLLKRAEFLAVAKGARSARRAFVLQALCGRGEDAPPRIGFTVTKKTGNAVERNRIRRRLREAVRLDGDRLARPGCDYVIVGRRDALVLAFDALRADLQGAFRQVHGDRGRAPRNQPVPAPAGETGRTASDTVSKPGASPPVAGPGGNR